MPESFSAPATTLVRAFRPPRGFGDQTQRDRRADAIELMGGIPDPSVLPAEALAESAVRVLGRDGVPALQYGRTEGVERLREWIARREGVPVSRVIITNGGFHGLSLAVHTTIDRGELVAVDDPIFPLFLRGLELSDARTLPISVGADGLDVDVLAERLAQGERPVALYTVPDFHNPSQGTMPAEARRELVRLAEHYGFVIIADNPYRELRFRGVDQGTAMFNESEHVVHVNTFTKTLGPGLRLGWLVVPEWLQGPVSALRSRTDGHSSQLVQEIVSDFVSSSDHAFDDTVSAARNLYRTRADTLAAALESHAPGEFEVAAPEGGLFLWPRLVDDAIDADRLAEDAVIEGVEYQRGGFFAASSNNLEAARHLRLAYGDVSADRLDEAAVRLARAINRQR